MAGYQDLKVWQSGMRLTLGVYRLTLEFPDDEKFGLVSQLRRAAVSVPSNIAEGHAKNSSGEMVRFANIALGSLAEIETQLLIAKSLEYSKHQKIDSLLAIAAETARMLHGLIRSRKQSDS
ncbi:MAG: four helix bundle protein [Planctomycetota bacterium]